VIDFITISALKFCTYIVNFVIYQWTMSSVAYVTTWMRINTNTNY
jgi:hypothetical protein